MCLVFKTSQDTVCHVSVLTLVCFVLALSRVSMSHLSLCKSYLSAHYELEHLTFVAENRLLGSYTH